ncbi:SA1002 family membrane protein [Staphylococcus aureus]|uniref:SA1002 family membrane protein n=1 Tax=Staphylococcus aureus TaxID=1280 RepID=UPI003D7FBC19
MWHASSTTLVVSSSASVVYNRQLFMGVVFIFIGYISLAISAVIIYGIIQFITIDFGSFFLMGIILILISSIFQLFIVRLLFRKKNVDLTEVVVLEHLIQWFLVYFAIYQAVNEKMDINDINIDNFQSVFFDVSNLNLVILPTLIISWVTIFNYRMRSYK